MHDACRPEIIRCGGCPAAGPFRARLGDGSVVTYSWYRFADQPALLNALMTPALVRNIQGSTTFIRGNQVSSLLAGGTYYVGSLPPVTRLQWILSRSPLLLGALVIVLALLGAAVSYAGLQLRARRRLSVNNKAK